MSKRGPLIFLAVALAAVLPFLVQIAKPFVMPFVLASVVAIVVYPVKELVALRLHRPGLATLVTTLATVCLLAIVLAVAGFTLTRELSSVYDALSQRSLWNRAGGRLSSQKRPIRSSKQWPHICLSTKKPSARNSSIA